jgi:hypothetical protein
MTSFRSFDAQGNMPVPYPVTVGGGKVDVFDIYDKMERNNILLSFKGEITSDLLTSILQIMENKMDNMQEEPKMKKKVYNVLKRLLFLLFFCSFIIYYFHMFSVD